MILNKYCKFNFGIVFIIYTHFTLSINDFYYGHLYSMFVIYNAWSESKKSKTKFNTNF